MVMWMPYGGRWADLGCEDASKLGAICETSLFPTW
jgi:hypothetical protein